MQKLFRFGDGERVVAALSLDPRITPEKNVVALAATRKGFVFRFSLDPLREPTTRAGRRFGKPAAGDEILFVGVCGKNDVVAMASEQGRAILFSSGEVPGPRRPGEGGHRPQARRREISSSAPRSSAPTRSAPSSSLENSKGTEHTVTKRYDVVGRGGRGFHLIKRDRLVRAIPPPVALVELSGKES